MIFEHEPLYCENVSPVSKKKRVNVKGAKGRD